MIEDIGRLSRGDESALTLRKELESGQVQASSLSPAQAGAVLASIEMDDAAGRDLSDQAIALFVELSERYQRNTQIVNGLGQLIEVVERSESARTSAMSRAITALNQGADLDRSAATHLGGMRRNSFRGERERVGVELDRVLGSVGLSG